MSDITPIYARGEGRTIGRIRGLWGELMAEFLGTFIILAFGDGCVAMAVAALPGSGRAATPTTIFLAAGDWLLIAFGWCFAVAFAVWVAGGVSGAHLNPAVTLAFAARRGFPWRKVLPYWAAQVVGAFTGAALVYMVYESAINAFNLAAKTPKSGGRRAGHVLDLRHLPRARTSTARTSARSSTRSSARRSWSCSSSPSSTPGTRRSARTSGR